MQFYSYLGALSFGDFIDAAVVSGSVKAVAMALAMAERIAISFNSNIQILHVEVLLLHHRKFSCQETKQNPISKHLHYFASAHPDVCVV